MIHGSGRSLLSCFVAYDLDAAEVSKIAHNRVAALAIYSGHHRKTPHRELVAQQRLKYLGTFLVGFESSYLMPGLLTPRQLL